MIGDVCCGSDGRSTAEMLNHASIHGSSQRYRCDTNREFEESMWQKLYPEPNLCDCHEVKVEVKDTARQKAIFAQARVIFPSHQGPSRYRTRCNQS